MIAGVKTKPERSVTTPARDCLRQGLHSRSLQAVNATTPDTTYLFTRHKHPAGPIHTSTPTSIQDYSVLDISVMKFSLAPLLVLGLAAGAMAKDQTQQVIISYPK